MTSRTERIIEIGALIAHNRGLVQSAQDRVRALEAELARLLDGSTPAPTPAAEKTLLQRVVDTLDAAPGRPHTIAHIAAVTGGKVDSVMASLSRLVAQGRIVRRQTGIYQSAR